MEEWVECTRFQKNSGSYSGVFLFVLLFIILDDPSSDLFFHIFTMSGLLEECEEVIFEKYLELSRLDYLDSRCT